MTKTGTAEGTYNGHSVKHLTIGYLHSLRIILLFTNVCQDTCP